MVDTKKPDWKLFSISREYSAPEGSTFPKSQSWVLLGTPLLPNLTAHSECQNFELRTSKLLSWCIEKAHREMQLRQLNFFEHVLFFCEVFVPPRREYGWTKLIRIQVNQITSPTQLLLLFLHMASFATTSDNQTSFFTRLTLLLWDKTVLLFPLTDGNWDNYLEVGLGVAMLKAARILQDAWIPDNNLLLRSAWVVCGESQASPNRVDKIHYTE